MNKPSKSKAEIEAEKLERLARWPTVESERDYYDRVDEESFDIIARMEAMQQRFGRFAPAGRLQLTDRETEAAADWIQDDEPPAFPGESESEYNDRTGRYDQ